MHALHYTVVYHMDIIYSIIVIIKLKFKFYPGTVSQRIIARIFL